MNLLKNYCIEVVCLSVCLCVYLSAMTLKWHANFKYIAIQLDMSELGQIMTIYDFLGSWGK